MSNLAVVLIYASLLVMSLVLLTPVLFRKKKVAIDYCFIAMSIFAIAWQGIMIVIFSLASEALALSLYMVRLIPIVFIPVAFFCLVVFYYNLEHTVSKWIGIAFTLSAIAVAVLAVSSDNYSFFWENGLRVIAMDPLVRFEGTFAPGYFLAVMLTGLPVVGVAYLTLIQRRKLPSEYRFSTTALLWCIAIYLFTVGFSVLGHVDDTGLDPSLFGVSVVNFFLYLVFVSKSRGDYLHFWQGDIYNYLEEAILIIDEREQIVDANKAAQKLFSSFDLTLKDYLDAESLRKGVDQNKKAFLRQLEGEDHETVSQDLYITDGEYPVIYEVQNSPITNAQGATLGRYSILTEVTRNRLYIERLQDLAGVDSLTGLPNRFSYEKTLPLWDCPENLPLSIIMGDLNNLKELNDGFGHQAGDILLKKAAEILQECCPPDGMVARIGGDEFIMVVKQHDEQAVAEIIDNIQALIGQVIDFPHLVSIALGSATKKRPEENINALYTEADARMYENKKAGEV